MSEKKQEESLDGVTTSGDIAILARKAKAARQRPAEYISHYLWISIGEAERLIQKAQADGKL